MVHRATSQSNEVCRGGISQALPSIGLDFLDSTVTYILRKDRPLNSYEEAQAAWSKYDAYLKSIESSISQSAYEFASASWHYDFNDPRSPHDAWVEELLIREVGTGERKEIRSLEIFVRLVGAYHDGHIELRYSGVKNYELTSGHSTNHGDWLYDEIRLSDEGLVLHEVEWSNGGVWLIKCNDVIYKWLPFR
jgi:hypothetical protein